MLHCLLGWLAAILESAGLVNLLLWLGSLHFKCGFSVKSKPQSTSMRSWGYHDHALPPVYYYCCCYYYLCTLWMGKSRVLFCQSSRPSLPSTQLLYLMATQFQMVSFLPAWSLLFIATLSRSCELHALAAMRQENICCCFGGDKWLRDIQIFHIQQAWFSFLHQRERNGIKG